jgi:4'-phosphopantetheinyl transferase
MRSDSPTIWLLDIADAPAEWCATASRWLTDDERRRRDAFVRAERREQFTLGHALLRIAAAARDGSDPARVTLSATAGDPPSITLPSGEPLAVSLSHSGRWIACAIAVGAAVGVDIEMISTERDVLAMSAMHFSAAEHAWVVRAIDPPHAFYALWTAKEALVKLRGGLGMSVRPEHLVFDVDEDGPVAPAPAASWHCEQPASDLALSVITTDSAALPYVLRHRPTRGSAPATDH